MISRKFKYTGPSGNLGRFGLVNDGDVVELTFKEAITVADDPRFVPVEAATEDKKEEKQEEKQAEAPAPTTEPVEAETPAPAEVPKQFGKKKGK